MLSTTVIVEKKLTAEVKTKPEEKVSLKPLSLSYMQKKAQDFAADSKYIEAEWQEHLRTVAKAREIFLEKNRAFSNFKDLESVSEWIVVERNQALIKWHDRIDMIRESIYGDEHAATKLFNTRGSDRDSELARELSIKMRKLIEPRREILNKLQRDVDQHSIIAFESPTAELDSATEATQSYWPTTWLWKKLGLRDSSSSLPRNASITLPSIKR